MLASAPNDEDQDRDRPQEGLGRRQRPSGLPLHERTPSQNNRMAGIRVVPYSPPRLVSDSKVLSAGASTSSSHRQRLLGGTGDDDSDDSDDSDHTARRANRSSWASRASWGSAVAVAAMAALTGAPGSAGSSGKDSSKGSSKGSSRDSFKDSFKVSRKGSRKGGRAAVPGAGKSGNGRNAKRTANLGREDEGEGFAGSGWGSALSSPLHDVSPLGSSGNKDVSGTKLIGPPRSPLANITAVNAPTRLLLHRQPQLQFGTHEYEVDRHDAASQPLSVILPDTSRMPSQLAASSTSLESLESLPSRTFPVSPIPTSPTSAFYPPPVVTASVSSPSPSSSAVSLSSVSSQQAPRPNSRRRNFIAVHKDKTFSLLPRVESTRKSSRRRDADPTASHKSPPLSFSSATIRSSGSHERLYSDAFSSDDRPSSPLTTSATLQDRSSLSPFTPSPDTSAVPDDPKPLAASEAGVSSWNYRLVGGLRKVPNTGDWKQKGKGRAVFSTELEEPPVSPVTVVAEPAATATAPPTHKTSGSDDSGASSLSFSASTASATTNYKVYAHSSSPVRHDSFDSFPHPPSSNQSAIFDNTTNIEILGASSPLAPPLPLLRPSTDPDQTFSSLASFGSFDSNSSLPNVVVLGQSSPPPPIPPRSPNRPRTTELVSSPAPPRTADTSFTIDSDLNYVLHGEPSSPAFVPPAPSSSGSSLVTTSRRPWPASTYSQESLVVPPLQPLRKRSNERFGYYKSRSRESLRRAASLKSISSVLTQEAASTFFAGQAFLNLNIPPVPVISVPRSAVSKTARRTLKPPGPSFPKRKPVPTLPAPPEDKVLERTPQKQVVRSNLWDLSPSVSPSSLSLPLQPLRAVQMLEEHPHQWSSQLSTVMSESESSGGGSPPISRPLSYMSGTPSGISGRRSSAGWAGSIHSRNILSISSSLGLPLDDARDRSSRGDSSILDRPHAAYMRSSGSLSPSTSGIASPPPPIRTVRDQDEHGDGLTDLHDVMRHPSRSGISSFFSSSSSSGRNLHSSASSRSLPGVGIPAWARLYYGSGERRFLGGGTSVSDLGYGDDAPGSPPPSAFCGSPSSEHLPLRLFNTRRRPHEVQTGVLQPVSGSDIERAEIPVRASGIRKMTSSIWSPHLRVDRRATRFSVWDPPSVTWSAETNSVFDRRNMQLIAFTIGFIFPFSWMIAAFLPLPPDPQRAMEKRAEGEYGMPEALKRRLAQTDEVRFQSARWWRSLNRIMSIFGLLILGAVVALVIVGIRQGWGQRH